MLRRRIFRDWFGREFVGIAVLVVLAVVCAGLVNAVVAKTRNEETLAARSAAGYTPPPIETPRPAGTGPFIAVIGDATTSTAAPGVRSTQRWTGLLSESIDGAVGVDASAGAGYVTRGTEGGTFRIAADRVPANARVVIFFGGAEDASIPAGSLATAATQAFAAAARRAPRAKLIVVGPAVAPATSQTDLVKIRSALGSAARAARASWIDPVAANWLMPQGQRGAAGALTAADEKVVAAEMVSAVKDVLK